MAGFMDEANAMLEKIADRIDATLLTTIAQTVSAQVSASVYKNVYPLYQPSQYVRRETAGGLPDASMYDVYLDPETHTLTVEDTRHEVGVVESGMGYDWEGSRIFKLQPFPRPYFQPAENELMASGELDQIMQQGLSNL